MTDCDLCTCIPNVLQSIQIHLLSSLHSIFHITTNVHIQSLGDFLFLLIDISAPGRPGQNWSSILTPFQRIHWQIHSVYSKKTQFYLYLLLIWIIKHSLYVINQNSTLQNTRPSGHRNVESTFKQRYFITLYNHWPTDDNKKAFKKVNS